MTTTIQSVANACSSSNRYVYQLPPLDEKKAKELFLQKPHPTLKVSEASEILKKCEGLPLAVISMSEFWKKQKSCEDALRNLGTYLVEEGDILSPNRMQRMLVNKYASLSSHDVKACLLYFCMFPCDNPARRNSLIRRWLAEGFAAAKPKRSPQQVAGDQLEDLIDRNIIQSMEADTNGNVKRCRPHGIMLEYISYKSMYENFAALMPPANHIRRIFLHQSHTTDDKWVSGIEFSRVRTLAVSGRACQAVMEFDKYHLLGVLDLKDCDYQLNTKQLQDICKLLLLKYLSLGNLPEKKNKLPRQMRRLLLLETLEVKKNEEPVGVYEEIIKLPKLKHLIGKFELLDNPGKDLENFMSKDSVLETLSGFVIGKSKGFPRLMSHMGQLRKVKIWCDANADDVNLNSTSISIKKFTHRGMEMGGNNRSLSIDFAKYSAVVLESLQDSGSLGSLKLRGDLIEFPPPPPHEKFVTKVKGVKELCLSSTNLSGDAILAALSKLDVLKYLKLVEDHLGSIVLTTETFKGLERLCLVCLPKLDITINNGALLDLVSLHILCEALAGVLPAGVQIGSLKKLNEIALLDSAGVTPAVKKELKASAMKHSNRPDVLFIKKSTPQVQSVPPASALPNGFVQQ